MNFWNRNKKPEEKRETQGSMKQERQQFADIEKKSDWVKHIQELKKLDVFSLLRQPPNPQLAYLLFHDGKYLGNYSSKRPLNTADVLMNQYLVYVVDLNRKTFKYQFNAPVADAPDKTILVKVTIKADISQPEILIEKGIWNIQEELQLRLEQVVRDISGRYKGAARSECEADLKRQIEAQEFDFGLRMIDVAVERDVPTWVTDKMREENEARRRADDEVKRKQEEARRKAEDEKERARKKREEEQRKLEEKRAEEARKAEERQARLEQEKEIQRFNTELSRLTREEDALTQIRARAAAEKDPSRREQLEKLVGQLEQYQAQQIEYERKERELRHADDAIAWERQKEADDRALAKEREDQNLKHEDDLHKRNMAFQDIKNRLYDSRSEEEIAQIHKDAEHRRKMEEKQLSMENMQMLLQSMIEGGVLSQGLLGQNSAISDLLRLLLTSGGVPSIDQVNVSKPAPVALPSTKPQKSLPPASDISDRESRLEDNQEPQEAQYAEDGDQDLGDLDTAQDDE